MTVYIKGSRTTPLVERVQAIIGKKVPILSEISLDNTFGEFDIETRGLTTQQQADLDALLASESFIKQPEGTISDI